MPSTLPTPPYPPDPEAQAWIAATLAALSPEDRLRQLFNLLLTGAPGEEERVAAFRPGSVTRHRADDATLERAAIARLQARAPVPLLVSSDLEGSRMSLGFGLEMPNPLALAAVDDEAVTEAVARLMAREARSIGINWTFTPVLDINAAFRSAIVATRGFGSDPDRILRHALATIRGFQAEGVAATAKHFPGEGYDDRDQHLLTTIIPQSLEEWEATSGRLYRAAIAAGVSAVMPGHIAFPAFAALQGEAGVELCRPATASRHLTHTLLRERLGFRGLVTSDATPMAGLGAWSKRSLHLPELVSAGCDVILFSDDPDRDLGYLRAAIADGRLTMARVDEAVSRQLALKAALGLHRGTGAAPYAHTDADRALVREATIRAPVLVKDVQGLLPLSPGRTRRVLVMTPGIVFPFLPEPLPFLVPDLLRKEGFEVTVHTPGSETDPAAFDLHLYLFGDETLLTRGRIFLDWLALTGHFGSAMRRWWHDVPCLMVSFGYPYMLYDAPRMPAAVNAWSTTESMQVAVVELLTGRATWRGTSPVDPFCGLPDARY